MGENTAYLLRLFTTIAMYGILAMGLNITLGLAGLLDMGYMGFYAVGAYTYSLLSSPQLGAHMPTYVALPAAVLASVILSLAVGIPTLRLSGDYLGIVTMGFAEIVRILLVNLDRPVNITNGPNGILQVDPFTLGPYRASSPVANFLLMSAFAMLAYVIYVHLAKSGLGLKWKALKDDPIAASSLGINTSLYRVLAFSSGAVFAGTAGALFAGWQGAVFPQNFSVNELIVLYCMVILGGAGNPKGTLAGAAAIVLLPELLRGYSVYRMLLYGVILILTMIYRPHGLFRAGLPSKTVSIQALVDSSAEKKINEPTAAGTGGDDGVSPVLSAKNITVKFGGVTALSGVSIDLARGEILSLIGPNGAGKTTLVNVLSGMTRADEGDVYLDGNRVTGFKPHLLHSLGLARTFQNNRLFTSLTVAENLRVPNGRIPGEWLEDLRPFAQNQAGNLSYGHRKSLEMARALAGRPKVVLLDEPAAGMSASGLESITRRVKALKENGYSVILVEHKMPVVMSVSDRVIALDQGRVVAQGKPAEVAADPNVLKAYLGYKTPAVQRTPLLADHPGASTRSGASSRDAAAPFLELRSLRVGYGPVRVLHDVSLTVKKGEIACVLGSNGAGKTTTLKAIMGAAEVESGKILLGGRDITGERTECLGSKGVAFVPEGRRLFGKMTVEENLMSGARPDASREQFARSKQSVFSLFPILQDRLAQKAGTLSGGEQQMLAIGRALMSSPSILLLDEPSMGLAPVVIDRIMRALRTLNENGLTVLMVEQNAYRALFACDRAYVLEGGYMKFEGNPKSLAEDDLLRTAYLGYAAVRS